MIQFAIWIYLLLLSVHWTYGGYNVVFTTVTEGRLRGITQRSAGGRMYQAFKGVPYARPPVGPLRWRPPQPPESWSGVRAAVRDPPQCPQYIVLSDTFLGDEDCLYLNVYIAPGTTSAPVIVWIHGGAYTAGSARQDHYGPDFFMDLEVILVAVNYRLGALGFLSTGDELLPGNYGLKDQAAALAWVKANARAFGGDPDRITLMGQSAGAAAVTMHLLSPHATGLMANAIALSGCAMAPWAVSRNPMAVFDRVASLVGCGPPPPENEREPYIWRMDDPGMDQGPEEGMEVHHFRVSHVGSGSHDSAYAFGERTDFDEFVAGTVPTQLMTERFVEDKEPEEEQDEEGDEDLQENDETGESSNEEEEEYDDDYEEYADEDEEGKTKTFDWGKIKRKAGRHLKKQVRKIARKTGLTQKKKKEEAETEEPEVGHSLADLAKKDDDDSEADEDEKVAEEKEKVQDGDGAPLQRSLHRGSKQCSVHSSGDEQYGCPSNVALHHRDRYGMKYWHQIAAEADGNQEGSGGKMKEEPEDDCPPCEDDETTDAPVEGTDEPPEDGNNVIASADDVNGPREDEDYTTLDRLAKQTDGVDVGEEDYGEKVARKNLEDEQTTTWRPLRVTPEPSTPQEKLECLMDVPPHNLVATLYYFPWWGIRMPTPFLPVIEKQKTDDDPPFLSGDPEQLLREGRVNDVPLLTGVTSGEGLCLALAVTSDNTLSRALRWRFRRILSHHVLFQRWSRADLMKLRHFYLRGGSPGAPCLEEFHLSSLTRLFSDAAIVAWQTRWARMWMYATAKPVFFYLFDFHGRAAQVVALGLAEEAMGVDHGDDLPYLFEDRNRPFPEGFRDLRERIATRVWSSILVNFARTGNPTPEKEMQMPVRWRPLGPGCSFRYLLFNDEPKMVDGMPYPEAMELWDYVEENPTQDHVEISLVSGEDDEDEKEEEAARSEAAAARRERDDARKKQHDEAERHRMEELKRAKELERKQRKAERERLGRQEQRFLEMVKRATMIDQARELENQQSRDRNIRNAKRAMIQQRHMEKRLMAGASTRSQISAMMADERNRKWQMEAAEAARRAFPETSEEEELRSRTELQQAWDAAVEEALRKEDEEERLLAVQDVFLGDSGQVEEDDSFASQTDEEEKEDEEEREEDEGKEFVAMVRAKGVTESLKPEDVAGAVVKEDDVDEQDLTVDKSSAKAARDTEYQAQKAAYAAAHAVHAVQAAANAKEEDPDSSLELMKEKAKEAAKQAEEGADEAVDVGNETKENEGSEDSIKIQAKNP